MKKFIFGIVSIIVVGIVVVDTKGTVLSVHFSGHKRDGSFCALCEV